MGNTEMLSAARAGDEAAFGELIAAYSPRLLRVAIPRDRSSAEDAVQEALLGAWRGLWGYRGDVTLSLPIAAQAE